VENVVVDLEENAGNISFPTSVVGGGRRAPQMRDVAYALLHAAFTIV